MFAKLSAEEKQVAAKLGVDEHYITKRCSGGRSDAAASSLHERFVAACVLGELTSDKEVGEVAGKWAAAEGLARNGALSCQLPSGLNIWLQIWAIRKRPRCGSSYATGRSSVASVIWNGWTVTNCSAGIDSGELQRLQGGLTKWTAMVRLRMAVSHLGWLCFAYTRAAIFGCLLYLSQKNTIRHDTLIILPLRLTFGIRTPC
jgi:hypothetical protein